MRRSRSRRVGAGREMRAGSLLDRYGARSRADHAQPAYETGASLYFTVIAPRAGDGPLGTISHHHAVGVDHAPYLVGEIGVLGVGVLSAVKRAVDPAGVMNPGKLVG